MFQRFFTDTIESKFVKALLRNTAVPQYPTVASDDYVISNGIYLNKYGIVKYDGSGKANSVTFTRLAPYIYNFYNKSFTEKYISKDNFYDSETHEKLGNYLRVYRDLNDIDLMPFYNCFSYKFLDYLYLDKSMTNGINFSHNDLYKIASVPIKFDKTYSIGIDSLTPIFIKSVLKDKFGLLKSKIQGENYLVTNLLNNCRVFVNNTEITNENCYEIVSSSYGDIIHYKISLEGVDNSIALKLKSMEKYLNLLIQINANNSSSITVLEGNYSNSYDTYNVYNMDFRSLSNIINNSDFKTREDVIDDIVNGESDFTHSNMFDSNSTSSFNAYVDSFSASDLENQNRFLLSRSSLLEIGTTETFAFSNRLIEYLLLNVVDNMDTIDDNITRVQKLLKLDNRKDVIPSVWSDLLRCTLYKNYIKLDSSTKFDINGFIDKDIEKMLMRGGSDY